MASANEIWGQVIGLLSAELTQTTMQTWFDDTKALQLDGDCLYLYTPSEFKQEIIMTRYLPYIKKCLQNIFSQELSVKVLTGEDDIDRYRSQKSLPAFLRNDDFTFDRFIVGSANKFAHAAAFAVAEKPANTYNPLFIYGGSGLGKTHLLYAIAHVIHNRHPDYRIVYIKGDDFTNELIESIKTGRNIEFREKYRSADLFLVDDIQFIAGKVSTQEEFFHTFNTLFESKRQIVLTSDRPPKEIYTLEDRLRSRFEWGLIADIQPPDFETRIAIIRNKCAMLGLSIPDEAAFFIAENITSNVRQIEGAVKKVLALRDLASNTVDIDTVSRAIKDIFKESPGLNPTPPIIIEEVATFYNVSEADIRGNKKGKEIAHARQVSMYLIRKLVGMSFPDIGREFGGKHHSTVLYACRLIGESIEKNPTFDGAIKDMLSNIRNK